MTLEIRSVLWALVLSKKCDAVIYIYTAIQIFCVCQMSTIIRGQTAGPIMNKFGTHRPNVWIDLGMVPT